MDLFDRRTVIVLMASVLLFLGRIEPGSAALIGVFGIGLIAASGRWLRRK